MLYSASLGGFIDQSLWIGGVPPDTVDVDQDAYSVLMEQQSAGKLIVAGVDAHPIAVDPPTLSPNELKGLADAVRRTLVLEATLRIAPLQDALDLGNATPEEKADLKRWRLYRLQLGRIEQAAGYPSAFSWPDPPDR